MSDCDASKIDIQHYLSDDNGDASVSLLILSHTCDPAAKMTKLSQIVYKNVSSHHQGRLGHFITDSGLAEACEASSAKAKNIDES